MAASDTQAGLLLSDPRKYVSIVGPPLPSRRPAARRPAVDLDPDDRNSEAVHRIEPCCASVTNSRRHRGTRARASRALAPGGAPVAGTASHPADPRSSRHPRRGRRLRGVALPDLDIVSVPGDETRCEPAHPPPSTRMRLMASGYQGRLLHAKAARRPGCPSTRLRLIDKLEADPGDEILHRARNEYLARARGAAMRAPMETAIPATLPSDELTLARVESCAKVETGLANPSTIAFAQWIARAGPSKLAKKPSPAVSISMPRKRVVHGGRCSWCPRGARATRGPRAASSRSSRRCP